MNKETFVAEESIEDLENEDSDYGDFEDEEDYCPDGYSWYWDGYYASYEAALIAHGMI